MRGLALFGSLLLPAASAKLTHNREPNIVLVVLDTARADHFSAYGYPSATTPRIDAISRRGALFLKAFAPAPETYTAVPRILSSRYLSHPLLQSDGWEWGIREAAPADVYLRSDAQQIFLPQILAQHGYRTALFTDHYAFSKETALARQFDELHYTPWPLAQSDERVVSKSIDWIRKKEHGKFFIYLHIMSPHGDYPAQDTDAEFLSGFDPGLITNVRKKFSGFLNPNAESWRPDELRVLQRLYDSKLKHTDRQIGALYDALETLQLAQNTIFLILSDHGENFGDHGRISHGGPLWDSIMHVPLIIVYPPRISRQTRVHGLVETIDIPPTLLDLAGIPPPPDKYLAGESLLQYIRHPNRGKKIVLSEDSIRTKDYKYIVSEKLLYDLKADPNEKLNLAQSQPKLAASLRDLQKRLIGPHLARYHDAKAVAPPVEPFYITTPRFDAAPRDSIDLFPLSKLAGPDVIRYSTRPWLLSNDGREPGILRHPTVSSAPALALSCPMPDGNYHISVLIRFLGQKVPSRKQFGLRFRFYPGEHYRTPLSVGPSIRRNGRSGLENYKYLDMGQVTVVNQNFRVQFDIPSPLDKPYLLRHIRFDPGIPVAPLKTPSAQDKRQVEELLKASGYLSN